MKPSLIAIVPAAGIGARAGCADGVPKQYRLLQGEPMLRRAVLALLADPRVAEVRVAVAADDPWVAQALAGLPRTVWRPCGGPTRAATVRAALQDAGLAPGVWVLVHDAARPGLPASVLAQLIDTCLWQDRGGLLALPVADTVKCAMPVASSARQDTASSPPPLDAVERTLPRDRLWLAQTPQMFRAGALIAALDACATDDRVTDEASAVELSGGLPPLLVPGSRRNDKLTWPEDFEWFESCLRGQAE
ncbi:2-C-methyl-D-erythritol 4-phosphate cytidylyltransferase [Castellaniella sp.]|uniref:IspD/TarI family cytidylyltransferase n=1 Tax=Castellaniella sp. TaxID=1955812 RepID=UPI002AFE67B2|nr:2-C-methyl-D-erythritol 4-phosphate cytidylyltransferase [Castellaniella sp.]